MSATPRTRTRVKKRTGQLKNGAIWQSSSYSVTDVCSDVIGDYGNNHSFDSTQFTVIEGGLYTEVVSSTLEFSNVPCAIPFRGTIGFNPSDYLAKLIARSGPLTPKLYTPVSIFELKDIPAMLRHAGDLLHKIYRPSGLNPVKEAAAANLAYQFGWAPLMGDIGKMLDFADVVRKRQRILAGAHSTRGIRRKVILDSIQLATHGKVTVYSSFGRLLEPSSMRKLERKVWGTVRWKVKDQSQIGRMPTFNEAFRTAYGFNRGHIPIEIWKALPWSWAIDWFANISEVLEANYNMIYYKPFGACFMVQDTFTTSTSPIYKGPLVIYTPGNFTKINRRRFPYNLGSSVNLSIKLPFLDNFKLSIISSLAITRLLR